MRKGTFFRAGQCAALSSFRVGKNANFVGKGYVFYKFRKKCFLQILEKVAEESMRFNYYIGMGCFLTGHSEKGYQFQNVEHSVWGKFCGPLFTQRYTVDQQGPPTPPPPPRV